LINFTKARSSIIILIKFASRIIVKENNGYLLVTFIGNKNHKWQPKNFKIFIKIIVTIKLFPNPPLIKQLSLVLFILSTNSIFTDVYS
jgi:hypothetical protein